MSKVSQWARAITRRTALRQVQRAAVQPIQAPKSFADLPPVMNTLRPRHGDVRLVAVPDAIWDDFVAVLVHAGAFELQDTAGDGRDWRVTA